MKSLFQMIATVAMAWFGLVTATDGALAANSGYSDDIFRRWAERPQFTSPSPVKADGGIRVAAPATSAAAAMAAAAAAAGTNAEALFSAATRLTLAGLGSDDADDAVGDGRRAGALHSTFDAATEAAGLDPAAVWRAGSLLVSAPLGVEMDAVAGASVAPQERHLAQSCKSSCNSGLCGSYCESCGKGCQRCGLCNTCSICDCPAVRPSPRHRVPRRLTYNLTGTPSTFFLIDLPGPVQQQRATVVNQQKQRRQCMRDLSGGSIFRPKRLRRLHSVPSWRGGL